MNDVLYLRNITCVLLTNEATAYHRCIYSVSQSFFYGKSTAYFWLRWKLCWY